MDRRQRPKELIGIAGHLNGKRNYSDEQIQAIVEATGLALPDAPTASVRWNPDTGEPAKVMVDRLVELSRRVENAAALFAHHSDWQSKPAPFRSKKQLHAIAVAAERLYEALFEVLGERRKDAQAPTAVQEMLQDQLARCAEHHQGYPAFPDIEPMTWTTADVNITDASRTAMRMSGSRCWRLPMPPQDGGSPASDCRAFFFGTFRPRSR